MSFVDVIQDVCQMHVWFDVVQDVIPDLVSEVISDALPVERSDLMTSRMPFLMSGHV